jgi:hypothetical protein
MYRLSEVTTVISTPRIFEALSDKHPTVPQPPPKKKPRYEVVRGEGERSHIVFTSHDLDAALNRLEALIRAGAHGAGIRKRKP